MSVTYYELLSATTNPRDGSTTWLLAQVFQTFAEAAARQTELEASGDTAVFRIDKVTRQVMRAYPAAA